MQENKEIKEATIEVRKMSEDEKMQRLADLREKAIMDERAIYAGALEKGIKQGLEQGREKIIEIVRNLYSMNTPINKIAEIVEIEEKEVKEILNLE